VVFSSHLAGSAIGSVSDPEGISQAKDLPYFQCPGVEVRSGKRKPTPNEIILLNIRREDQRQEGDRRIDGEEELTRWPPSFFNSLFS
jgi:hypothetical protein